MVMSNIVKHRFTITYEASIDTDSGEILETKIVSKSEPKESTKKPKVVDTETVPKLYLEDNKYRLNSAAAELMQVLPDNKLDIKYEQTKNGTFPIIGDDEVYGTHNGNRLTKSLTVSFRGAKHEELAKFGKEFNVLPHPKKDGLFVLSTGKVPEFEELNGDENVYLEEDDLNLEDLINDKDAQVKEINSDFFNFNL